MTFQDSLNAYRGRLYSVKAISLDLEFCIAVLFGQYMQPADVFTQT